MKARTAQPVRRKRKRVKPQMDPAHPCPTPGKRAYKTSTEAYSVALLRSRAAGPLRVYPCHSGKFLHFHLTSKVDTAYVRKAS